MSYGISRNRLSLCTSCCSYPRLPQLNCYTSQFFSSWSFAYSCRQFVRAIPRFVWYKLKTYWHVFVSQFDVRLIQSVSGKLDNFGIALSFAKCDLASRFLANDLLETSLCKIIQNLVETQTFWIRRGACINYQLKMAGTRKLQALIVHSQGKTLLDFELLCKLSLDLHYVEHLNSSRKP